ncbi:hypothetical protein LZL87_003004 [Fusarium oxysporum]|nr:hypothetical protein LZL87_003004 [Fusarium oxysporum]
MSTPQPTHTPSDMDGEMYVKNFLDEFGRLREILNLAKQTEQSPDSSGESPEDETLWGSPPSPSPSPNVSANMTLAFPVPVPSEVLEPAIPEENNTVPQGQPSDVDPSKELTLFETLKQSISAEASITVPQDETSTYNFNTSLDLPVSWDNLVPPIPEGSNALYQDEIAWDIHMEKLLNPNSDVVGPYAGMSNNASQLGGIPEQQAPGPAPVNESSSPVSTESNTMPQSQDPQFEVDAVVNDDLTSVSPELNEASKPKKSRAAAKRKPKRSPKRAAKPPKPLSAHKLQQQLDREGLIERRKQWMADAEAEEAKAAAQRAATQRAAAQRAAAQRTEQVVADFGAQAPFYGVTGLHYGQNPFQTPALSLYPQAVPVYQPPPQIPTQSMDQGLFGQSLPAAQYPFAMPQYQNGYNWF